MRRVEAGPLHDEVGLAQTYGTHLPALQAYLVEAE